MAEATSYRFRTAVGGFHKGDVCAYISKMSSQHRAETAELQQELDRLQQENESLRTQAASVEASLHDLRDDSAETVEVEVSEFPENITDLELTAYRRAEAAERLAHQRAKQLYEDMQSIYVQAGTQLRTVSGAAGKAMDSIEEAMHAVKAALEDTQKSVKRAQQSLEDMGALVPDPAEGLEGEA